MSINAEVIAALASLKIPVAFQTYSGGEFPYLTFFTYLERGQLHSDDQELVTGYYLQLDLWSKEDYTALVETIQQQMDQAGFVRQNFYDLYEVDLQVYHKVMRYYKEVL